MAATWNPSALSLLPPSATELHGEELHRSHSIDRAQHSTLMGCDEQHYYQLCYHTDVIPASENLSWPRCQARSSRQEVTAVWPVEVQGCKMSGGFQQPAPISASMKWEQAIDCSEGLSDGQGLSSGPGEITWQLALGTYPPAYLLTNSNI